MQTIEYLKCYSCDHDVTTFGLNITALGLKLNKLEPDLLICPDCNRKFATIIETTGDL